ncbi:MAG: Mrp/NBP35 family ATP-binding protein [Saprospiraceae bacterium]|nr:Mrp/NBP35 family ATP-binding protein [Saprospiraceae bacterium]
MEILDKIIEILEGIKEPKTGQSITLLKMIRDLKVENENIYLNIYLPSSDYPFKSELYSAIHDLLNKEFPLHKVHAHFVNKSAFSEAPNLLLPQIKNFIAIASGKGGVGKSTCSVNLAIALQKLGLTVGLLDCDLYGPSLPTMLGIQSLRPKVQNIQSQNKLVPIEVHGIPSLSLGNIIEPEQAVVLRGPRLAAIIKQFFQDALWPDLDYLVIDLPPGTGDVQLTLVQTIPLTGAVIVTTPQQVAVIDAIKASNMFLMDQIAVPVLGVVENMSWFQPSDMPDKKYYLFGEGGGERLAELTESSFFGKIPIIEKIRERADSGKVFEVNSDEIYGKIYLEIAERIHKKVTLRNMMMMPTKKVEQA